MAEIEFIESVCLLGISDVMEQLYKMIGRVCNSDCAVLLIGEPGTGKGVIARALHYFSHRSALPFRHIDGKITRETVDEKLLGIEGSHQAEGTCYVTHLTSMTPFLQHQLLNVYQKGEYKCSHKGNNRRHNLRFIVANEGNIKEEIASGKIPADLFYDWNFLPLYIPPLRDRKEDIPLLAQHFLQEIAQEMKISSKEFSPEALEILQSYVWPGNLSELKTVLHSALLACRGNYIRAEHLPALGKQTTKSKEAQARLEMFLSSKLSSYIEGSSDIALKGNLYRLLVPQLEKSLFQYALKRCKGNRNKAARLLGLHRNTLNKKLRQYSLPHK